MAIHSSISAWRIPWTEKPGGLQFIGLQKVGHNSACMHAYTLVKCDQRTKLEVFTGYTENYHRNHCILLSWHSVTKYSLVSTVSVKMKK